MLTTARLACLTFTCVLLAVTPTAVGGLKAHTGETPIVFTMSGDPLEAKWIASLARPGGNVTGMSSLQLELEAKRLELLKELRPGLARVALLGNELHPG
jgi:putative ABC transport system substrate-binding protein